jgi:hypothetical protein
MLTATHTHAATAASRRTVAQVITVVDFQQYWLYVKARMPIQPASPNSASNCPKRKKRYRREAKEGQNTQYPWPFIYIYISFFPHLQDSDDVAAGAANGQLTSDQKAGKQDDNGKLNGQELQAEKFRSLHHLLHSKGLHQEQDAERHQDQHADGLKVCGRGAVVIILGAIHRAIKDAKVAGAEATAGNMRGIERCGAGKVFYRVGLDHPSPTHGGFFSGPIIAHKVGGQGDCDGHRADAKRIRKDSPSG